MELLWGMAYRYTGSRADAEDLLQELVTRLYPGRDQLQAVENLRPWLVRSLHNLFIDTRRRWSRNVLSRTGQVDEEELLNLEDGAEGPEAALVSDQRRRDITTALDTLDPDQRAVVVLHDMEGYTLPELQELLAVPVGTLKSRLFRARRRLRDLLTGNVSGDAGVLVERRGES